MIQTLSMSATKLSAFLNNFDRWEINKEDILEAANITDNLFDSPDHRISAETVDQIIKTVVHLTGNENIGLHQGQSLQKGFSNILGYILMNCCLVKEALEKYEKYEAIIDQTGSFHYEVQGDRVLLVSNTKEGPLKANRQFLEFKIAGTYTYIKLLTGQAPKLREVHFTHSMPEDVSEYEKVFGCCIKFQEAYNALVLDKDFLQTKILEPNKELLDLFEIKAESMQSELTEEGVYSKRVKKIIQKSMIGSVPSVQYAAKQLGISVRTLQLYLEEEGSSYRKLVSEVRQEAAKRYLMKQDLSIDEIIYILGYSETSTFYKAFKRWTGYTPHNFKKLSNVIKLG